MTRIINSFKTIAYVVDKQSDICRRFLQLQELCVQSVKLQHMYVICLILLSVLETTKQTRLYQI